jgi:catechol 2,3-dioxygenase-like lactoylglutathione lyase family enzyme
MTSSIDAGIVFFGTRDLEATSRFYGERLGLPLVVDQGRCRIFRMADTSYVGFCLREEASTVPGTILTLVTEDVDGWAAALRARDVALERGPVHNETYGIYHLFFRDPNGYLIEIQRFDDPHWSDPEDDDTPL